MTDVGSTITVGAVILRGETGAVLTVRKRGTLRFMFPGGKLEPGESPLDAAMRECAEELGVELNRRMLRRFGTFRAAAANEEGFEVDATVFEAMEPVGVVWPAAEIEEVRWLDPGVATLPADLAPLLVKAVLPKLRHRPLPWFAGWMPERSRSVELASGRFQRAGGRHRFTARRGHVVSVMRPAPVMLRVRVTGDDFADFVSTGPSDHMRVFFPDPETGEYNAPTAAGPGEDGIVRPEGVAYARDFTPLRVVRTDDGVAVDIDFYYHPSPGPASSWAQIAAPGDELVIVGPRGSRDAPQDADRLLLIVDETALPAAGRFAREVPTATAVDLVAITDDDGAWVPEYFADVSDRTDASVHTVPGPAEGDALVNAIDTAGGIDDGTFVFAAAEASALLPLRRHLRGDLRLSREQVAISGYWRRGVTAFDHHTPIDPEDPD